MGDFPTPISCVSLCEKDEIDQLMHEVKNQLKKESDFVFGCFSSGDSNNVGKNARCWRVC